VRGCHTCEHATAIAEGKFAGKRWEDVPCSTCDVMSGAGFALEFDESRGVVGDQQLAVGSSREGLEDRLPVSVMREIVVGLLKLRPELRDVVAWRYAGVKYADIALVQGVTRACVEKRHRRAMELWPALRSLFPRKSAKQSMRKPHGREGR
jgi:hypothetical protein